MIVKCTLNKLYFGLSFIYYSTYVFYQNKLNKYNKLIMIKEYNKRYINISTQKYNINKL